MNDLSHLRRPTGLPSFLPAKIQQPLLPLRQPTPLVYQFYRPHSDPELDRIILDQKSVDPKDLEYVQRFRLEEKNMPTRPTFITQHPFLYDSFVPLDVQFLFEQTIHRRETYEWNHFTLHLFLPAISVSPGWVRQIFQALQFISSLPEFPCEKLAIKLFPSSRTKTIAQHAPWWTPFSINTASTYRNNCSSIFIWRQEEVIKSLFHEVIHAIGYDPDQTPPSVIARIRRDFALAPESSILLAEAYTEYMAELLNLRFLEVLEQGVFETLYHEEALFSLVQVGKILWASGFAEWSAFFRPISPTIHNPLLHQTTSVFSYFVVRSAMYYNPWFRDHLRNVDFKKNEVSLEVFYDHLESTFLDPAFQFAVNESIRKAPFRGNSMRMTHPTHEAMLDKG